MLSGWSEIGTQVLAPQTLGQGLGLPSSETVSVPMAGVDYVDIEMPGAGVTVRGALVVALRQTQTREGLDFGGTAAVTDPFGNGNRGGDGIGRRAFVRAGEGDARAGGDRAGYGTTIPAGGGIRFPAGSGAADRAC